MLLSELSFGSYLTYSPHGISELEKKSQNIVNKLKNERSIGNPPIFMSQCVVDQINENLNQLPFKDFFGSDVSLVPVLRSCLMQPGTLWVSEKIVKAMVKYGFGESYPCLTRIKSVPKAAFSKASDRAQAIDHYNTIECQPLVNVPTKIVLVDDVITSGSTIRGCASKLKEVFPNADIRAFAIIRTISNSNEFKKIVDPRVGTISGCGNRTFRRP